MFSWKNIVKRHISDPDPDHAKYEEFKRRCLDDFYTLKRLTDTYGNVDRLDDESIEQDIYLHVEMNLLANIIDQKYKGRAFIAVSKRSCYLCESYIRFVNGKGYKVYTSGAHKKLYSKLLLPELKDTALRNESLNYMIKQLDQVINSIVARSDSDGESVKTNVHEKGSNLFVAKKPNKPKLIKTTY